MTTEELEAKLIAEFHDCDDAERCNELLEQIAAVQCAMLYGAQR